jgi:integrase
MELAQRNEPSSLVRTVSLPALSPLSRDDRERIEAATDETIARLTREGRLSANTRRSYASALRYWSAWHVAAFGEPLALHRVPVAPVGPDVVRAFVAHHAPTVDGGRLRLAMPALVRERLAALLAVRRRQVHRRSEAIKADQDVPTLATIRHRVSALSALHGLLGLPSPFASDPGLRGLLRSLAVVASSDAPIMLRLPKQPITRDLLEALLAQCDEDPTPDGIRDAAMFAAGFFSGGRRRNEIAGMCREHLTATTVENRPAWRWTIPSAKGKVRDRADRGVIETLIIGPAAERLTRWIEWLDAHRLPSETGTRARAVWRRLRTGPDGRWFVGDPMDGEDIAQRLQTRLARLGLDPRRYGAHSLRSGAVTTLLEDGGDLATAAALAGHANLETTRRHYDHRAVPIDGLLRLAGAHPAQRQGNR